MSLKYSKIMVPALALALNLSLYAQESYTTHTKSLKEAIENIAKQANLPYIADGTLLENKTTKPITNITNLQSALDEVLEGSNLKAVIQEGTILIVEKERNLSNTTLEVIDFVVRTNDGTAEDGYVVKELKQVGPWGEKSLQDTPYSMTVMPQELIENSIAGDMDQLYKMNPIIQNSTPMSVDGYPIAVFRGFTNDIGIIDGIRLSSNSRGIAMEELERVEIINGLTGFMYGVSGGEGIGGTTNYVLKRPTYQQLTNLTIGNYGGEQYFAHLDLGDKLDEKGKFAYRLNVSYQDGETSKDDQNVEKKLISGAIDWNVTDNFQLQLEAAHKFWRIDRPDNRFYTQGFTDWPEAYDNEKTFSPDWTYNQTKTDRVGLNATWNINDIFTLRTAYMYKKDNREFIIIYPILTPSGWTMYKPSKTAPYDTISHSTYTYLDSKFDTGNISHKLTFGISGDTYKERKYANSNVYDINPSYVTPSGLTED
ncbi:MAG: TonB-dependent receptor plug domain-containing protein, partial [Arcobacteraceae bacterium]|nr:TonB-dependent receptor plug domain-containing protein [Arcobacteraceae bacterium]